jgi:hypothetical protein
VSADRYRTLALTPLGREVMRGGRDDVVIAAPAKRPSSRRRSRPSPLVFPPAREISRFFRR